MKSRAGSCLPLQGRKLNPSWDRDAPANPENLLLGQSQPDPRTAAGQSIFLSFLYLLQRNPERERDQGGNTKEQEDWGSLGLRSGPEALRLLSFSSASPSKPRRGHLPTDWRVATSCQRHPPPLAMADIDIILAAKEEAVIPVLVKPTAPSTTGTATTVEAEQGEDKVRG